VAGSSRSRHTPRSHSATDRSAPTSPTSHTRPVVSRKRRRISPEASEATPAPASDEEEDDEPVKPLRKRRRIASGDLTESRNQLGSSPELMDNQDEMEQDDNEYTLPATPPPPTPVPRRPPIKPSNAVHSSPSVIPGTQTQTEWSQRDSSNRARTVPKSPRPKKSVPMRPIPVATVEDFKRTKESPASEIAEYSSPERLTKKTALTEGMSWPEKAKPPIQKRPLEDIFSKSKSQTVGPMKSSTLQPIISSSRSSPHKAAKGRPGVDAEGSQDPKGNAQTESDVSNRRQCTIC
jgi:hypothetical protein